MTHPCSPSDDADALSRTFELLAAYGADPRRWPANEAALFSALERDPRFQTARAETRALDEALDVAAGVANTDGLKERILRDFPGRRQVAPFEAAFRFCTQGFGRLAPIGAAIGLSALGFAVGAASAGVSAAENEALYYALDTSIVAIGDEDAFWAEEQ